MESWLQLNTSVATEATNPGSTVRGCQSWRSPRFALLDRKRSTPTGGHCARVQLNSAGALRRTGNQGSRPLLRPGFNGSAHRLSDGVSPDPPNALLATKTPPGSDRKNRFVYFALCGVKRRKRTEITDATKAEVKKLAVAGKRGKKIAKAVGISLPSVQNIKKALGITRKKR